MQVRVLPPGAICAGIVPIPTSAALTASEITNLAALKLPAEHRRYSRWVPALGLASCLGLAFWVDPIIWLVGLGLIAAGLGWKLLARRWRPQSNS